MTAPFATIETATAANAVAALANVEATVAGGDLLGVFDAAYGESFGISGTTPVLLCDDTDLADLAVVAGDTVTIGSDSYTVSRIEADGTGMSRLILDAA